MGQGGWVVVSGIGWGTPHTHVHPHVHACMYMHMCTHMHAC